VVSVDGAQRLPSLCYIADGIIDVLKIAVEVGERVAVSSWRIGNLLVQSVVWL
jgi:hypothetical protein